MDISAGSIPCLDWEVACLCNIKHSLATAPVQGHWSSNELLQIPKRGRKDLGTAWKEILGLMFQQSQGEEGQRGISCCLCAYLRQVRDSQKQLAYEQCDMRASPAWMLQSCVGDLGSWTKHSMEMMQGAIHNRPIVPIFSCSFLFSLSVLVQMSDKFSRSVVPYSNQQLNGTIRSPPTSFLFITADLSEVSYLTWNSAAVLASFSLSSLVTSLSLLRE